MSKTLKITYRLVKISTFLTVYDDPYFESQQLVGDARGALEDYIEQMIAMSFEENNKKNAFHAPARP